MRALLVSLVVLVLTASLAEAQNRRFVARGGSGDVCSYAAPCADIFAAAVSGTGGGTIKMLSEGEFSNLLTGNPWSLEGAGPGSNLNGFTWYGSAKHVFAKNLSFSISSSVNFTASGSLTMEQVEISSRTGSAPTSGLSFAPTGPTSLTLRNIAFTGASAGAGAAIQIVTGGHNINVTLDNVKVSGGIRGIVIDASAGGFAKINIENSSFTNITGPAIYGNAGSGNIRLYLDNVSATNSNVGVVMAGANALAWMTQSKIAGNATGIQQAAGAKIYSYKDNQIFNNGTDGTPLPASPSPVQSMPGGEIASVLR